MMTEASFEKVRGGEGKRGGRRLAKGRKRNEDENKGHEKDDCATRFTRDSQTALTLACWIAVRKRGCKSNFICAPAEVIVIVTVDVDPSSVSLPPSCRSRGARSEPFLLGT